MLKIYSSCLICILKVKYAKFKFPYFTTDSSACQPACLPAVRPGSTMARAPVFHTITVIATDLRNQCSEERLSTAPWCFLLVSTILRNGTPSSVKYLFYGTVSKHALDSYLP